MPAAQQSQGAPACGCQKLHAVTRSTSPRISTTPAFSPYCRASVTGKADNLEKLVDATRSFQVRDSISIKDRWRACGSAADFVIESISKGAL